MRRAMSRRVPSDTRPKSLTVLNPSDWMFPPVPALNEIAGILLLLLLLGGGVYAVRRRAARPAN